MNVKIKKIIILFFYYTTFWMKSRNNSLTVLTYHKITETPDLHDPLKISVLNFENQICYLKKYYTILSGDQLADILLNNKVYPENACLITFDDGWLDNYTHALPILRKHGVPAVIFISTDYIGTKNSYWHERLSNTLMKIERGSIQSINSDNMLPRLINNLISMLPDIQHEKRIYHINQIIEQFKLYSPENIEFYTQRIENVIGVAGGNDTPTVLSWEQVQEMAADQITFGSHTKSHKILTNISIDDVVNELAGSKKIIERKTGKPAYFIAYPNGNYNEGIIRASKRLGYLAGFTCEPGKNTDVNNKFTMKRKHVHESVSLDLHGKYSELYFKAEMSDVRTSLKQRISRIKHG